MFPKQRIFVVGQRAQNTFSIVAYILTAAIFAIAIKAVLVSDTISRHGKNLSPTAHFNRVATGSRVDWTLGAELPEFCKQIIANPKPLKKLCYADLNTFQCPNATDYRMFSQFQQDYYFYSRHFKYLNRPGVYLDIAANNPVTISNTFFMDRCLGWKGVCVEANPNYHDKLYRMRSCQLVPTCVGSKEGQGVRFNLRGGVSGIVGKTYRHGKDAMHLISRRCTMMKIILARNGITQVDFLSLDVEGHELEVLKGFDWDKVIVNVMSIETSETSLVQIEKYLTSKGYIRHIPDLNENSKKNGRIRDDAVFVHPSVEFGKPR